VSYFGENPTPGKGRAAGIRRRALTRTAGRIGGGGLAARSLPAAVTTGAARRPAAHGTATWRSGVNFANQCRP
jgi:hypothetical protein